jgi:N-sulfoglucosamine sulfohydrolase
MYYPMRVVRERRYKLIWNIAHGLDYPFASDLWEASTWQVTIRRGEKYYGKRTVEAYIHRPKFELYDLKNDPDEVKNLAGNPKYKRVLTKLKAKLKAFQKRTKDPWIVKWQYE